MTPEELSNYRAALLTRIPDWVHRFGSAMEALEYVYPDIAEELKKKGIDPDVDWSIQKGMKLSHLVLAKQLKGILGAIEDQEHDLKGTIYAVHKSFFLDAEND